MALENLGEALHERLQARALLLGRRDANEGDDRIAELLVVDLHAVAGDQAGVFHPAHAFRDRGRREADAAPQLAERNPPAERRSTFSIWVFRP